MKNWVTALVWFLSMDMYSVWFCFLYYKMNLVKNVTIIRSWWAFYCENFSARVMLKDFLQSKLLVYFITLLQSFVNNIWGHFEDKSSFTLLWHFEDQEKKLGKSYLTEQFSQIKRSMAQHFRQIKCSRTVLSNDSFGYVLYCAMTCLKKN